MKPPLAAAACASALLVLGGTELRAAAAPPRARVLGEAATVRRPPERPDAALYAEAKRARATLESSPRLQAQSAVWQRVIGRYRLVVARYPRSGYCDDALLAVGDLYRAMAKRFKKPALLDEAARAYEALAGEYPSSRHAETALFAVFEIARSSRDKKRLLEAGRSYVDAFPDSPRAPAVKATLRQRVPDKAASLPSPPPPGLASIYDLRFWSGTAATRVVVDLARKVKIESDRIRDPERLWIDLLGTRLHPRLEKRHFAVGDGLLEAIRVGPNREGVVRVVLDFKEVGDYNLFYLDDPPRLVVDVKGRARPMVASAPAAEREQETAVARAAPPAVVEVVPDADGDVGTDDPAAPSVPRAAPSPSPAPAREEVAQSTAPAATSAPAAPESLPSRRVSALASVEPPPPGPPKPAPSPVVIDSPPPPRRSAVAQASPAPAPAPGPPPAAQANRAGSYSLARQLGLGARRIVIDAGHGGHDPGTIGRGGLMEKDLVLDVALRLEKMVRQELGAEVLLTRGTDVFVPLEERTAIANSRGADLFLSIHANSSRNSRARGVETYFLSFARDAHAEEVAARENAISAATMKDLQGLVKAIALNSKIDESRDFAASVQEALVETIRGRYPVTNRGVHTAPFYVLIGANMPSILAEIAFLSNPEDEKLLKTPAYREAIARSLLKGVRGYLEGLPRPPARALTSLAPRSTVADGGR